MKRFLLAFALSSWACATPRPPPPAAPALPPLPRSSIAAVLEHRSELALTDEQVKRMQALDEKLNEDNAAIRSELRARRQGSGTSSPGGHGDGGEMGNGMGGMGGSMGGMGGGMGGRGMGGMGGMGGGRGMGGMGGGRHRGGGGENPAEAESRREAARQRIDDNDTKAYLDAEAVLTEAQKPRARELASTYREQLYERREAMRRQRDGE